MIMFLLPMCDNSIALLALTERVNFFSQFWIYTSFECDLGKGHRTGEHPYAKSEAKSTFIVFLKTSGYAADWESYFVSSVHPYYFRFSYWFGCSINVFIFLSIIQSSIISASVQNNLVLRHQPKVRLISASDYATSFSTVCNYAHSVCKRSFRRWLPSFGTSSPIWFKEESILLLLNTFQ